MSVIMMWWIIRLLYDYVIRSNVVYLWWWSLDNCLWLLDDEYV